MPTTTVGYVSLRFTLPLLSSWSVLSPLMCPHCDKFDNHPPLNSFGNRSTSATTNSFWLRIARQFQRMIRCAAAIGGKPHAMLDNDSRAIHTTLGRGAALAF